MNRVRPKLVRVTNVIRIRNICEKNLSRFNFVCSHRICPPPLIVLILVFVFGIDIWLRKRFLCKNNMKSKLKNCLIKMKTDSLEKAFCSIQN